MKKIKHTKKLLSSYAKQISNKLKDFFQNQLLPLKEAIAPILISEIIKSIVTLVKDFITEIFIWLI